MKCLLEWSRAPGSSASAGRGSEGRRGGMLAPATRWSGRSVTTLAHEMCTSSGATPPRRSAASVPPRGGTQPDTSRRPDQSRPPAARPGTISRGHRALPHRPHRGTGPRPGGLQSRIYAVLRASSSYLNRGNAAGCSMFLPNFLPHLLSKRLFLILKVR